MTKRLDIAIINTTTDLWIERIEALPDRPVFAVLNAPVLGGYVLTPYRTVTRDGASYTVLWRINRPGAQREQGAATTHATSGVEIRSRRPARAEGVQ